MSVPALLSALYTPVNSTYTASRTTAAIDLGTGPGRALLVIASNDAGAGAGYNFTGATVGGVAMTAGTQKGSAAPVVRAFWLTDAGGLPEGSQTITVNSDGTRNMVIMALVYKDGAPSGASIAVTPTNFASTYISGGANSYTVNSTTTAGLAVAVGVCPGNVTTDASSNNASTYRRDPGYITFETMTKTGSAGSTAFTWQTAGGATLGYDTFGFALLGSSGGGDTTEPTQTGAITIGTVTDTSIQLSWPAGADNVGVVGYDVSRDGGSTWTQLGNVLTHTWTGLTASTTYALRVRPRDAAGNVDSTPLAASQATSAASSTASITIPGLSAWTGTVQAGLTVPNLVVVRRSDRAQVLALTGQVADSSGNLVITNAALTAGVAYMVLGFTDDGASSFRRAVTAA